jgi:aspartyl/asparaginyl beta-hydroxylase (cupin superfamily)
MTQPKVSSPQISETDAQSRLAREPGDAAALLALADHRFIAGDHRAANAYYAAFIRRGQQVLVDQEEMERASVIVAWCADQFRLHLLRALDGAGLGEGKRPPRLQSTLETMFGERERPPVYQRFPQLPSVLFYPDLPHVEFADPAAFDWVQPLEARFGDMREEALALLEGHEGFRPYVKTDKRRPQGDVHSMLENPDWSSLFLWENGAEVKEHTARCPNIFQSVMDLVPLCHIGVRSPTVMLSLLRPGAHIPPHSGMLNCRYICHLPLIVPPDCGFRVGHKTVAWEEGHVLMFDDTVEHEAWNHSAFDRLILLFDVWRPELSAEEQRGVIALFDAVDSYGV